MLSGKSHSIATASAWCCSSCNLQFIWSIEDYNCVDPECGVWFGLNRFTAIQFEGFRFDGFFWNAQHKAKDVGAPEFSRHGEVNMTFCKRATFRWFFANERLLDDFFLPTWRVPWNWWWFDMSQSPSPRDCVAEKIESGAPMTELWLRKKQRAVLGQTWLKYATLRSKQEQDMRRCSPISFPSKYIKLYIYIYNYTHTIIINHTYLS